MVLDPTWLPNGSMRRVICHWTAGTHKASSLDRQHYHVLIEGDGTLVRGIHSIADNVSTGDGDYAAHTLGANTGSIGIALCGMLNAKPKPAFDAGPHPISEEQWLVLVDAVADLCRAYSIAVTPTTVLGHGEVEVNLGIKQKGKWDPMTLPWALSFSSMQVGAHLRALVQQRLSQTSEPVETPLEVNVLYQGKPIGKALFTNGTSYARAADVAARLGLASLDPDAVELPLPGGGTMAIDTIEGEPRVDVVALATLLGLAVKWNAAQRRLALG
jgi:N-acetylmuramoyl-L-alanine amidase